MFGSGFEASIAGNIIFDCAVKTEIDGISITGGPRTLYSYFKYIYSDTARDFNASTNTFINSNQNLRIQQDVAILKNRSTTIPNVKVIAFNATLAFDVENSFIQESEDLTAETTVSITNTVIGGTYKLYLPIDAVGGFAINFGSGFGTLQNGLSPISSTTANATYIVTIEVSPSGFVAYKYEIY